MRKVGLLACLLTLTLFSAYAGEGFLKGKILKIEMKDVVAERGGYPKSPMIWTPGNNQRS